MKQLLIKILALLIFVPILILVGLYLLPPGREVIEERIPFQSDQDLSSLTGWYVSETGDSFCVTWGAKCDLNVNRYSRFRDELRSISLKHIQDGQFDADNKDLTVEALFESDTLSKNNILALNTSSTKIVGAQTNMGPYRMKELEYNNGDLKLYGTLFIPTSSKFHSGLVMIHGSGNSDRDNFWYMHMADYMAKQGHIILLPDKRGCGKSSGTWQSASFNDLAGDIIAGLEALRGDTSLEISHTGVMGLSQGGWISHIVDDLYPALDFIVDVVSSATTPYEQVRHEVESDIRNAGVPELFSGVLAVVFTKRVVGKRPEWWKMNGSFDPLPLIMKSSTPLFKIFGGDDEWDNVPVVLSMERLEALPRFGNEGFTVKVYEDSGHAMIDPQTGWIRDDFLEDVSSWIQSVANE